MRAGLTTAILLSALAGTASAMPPALPCTSDYEWQASRIVSAIQNGKITTLANWATKDAKFYSVGVVQATGPDEIQKYLVRFSNTSGPIDTIVMYDSMIVAFNAKEQTRDARGNSVTAAKRLAFDLRCEAPGRISSIQRWDGINESVQNSLRGQVR